VKPDKELREQEKRPKPRGRDATRMCWLLEGQDLRPRAAEASQTVRARGDIMGY
jgi:hypothetical protein